MRRTDVDDDELPQITLGTAERQLLANLTLKSEMLDCTLKFLYKSNHCGNFQFLDSLPVQFRLVSHRTSVNLQQVRFQHLSHPGYHMHVAACPAAAAFCHTEPYLHSRHLNSLSSATVPEYS